MILEESSSSLWFVFESLGSKLAPCFTFLKNCSSTLNTTIVQRRDNRLLFARQGSFSRAQFMQEFSNSQVGFMNVIWAEFILCSVTLASLAFGGTRTLPLLALPRVATYFQRVLPSILENHCFLERLRLLPLHPDQYLIHRWSMIPCLLLVMLHCLLEELVKRLRNSSLLAVGEDSFLMVSQVDQAF